MKFAQLIRQKGNRPQLILTNESERGDFVPMEEVFPKVGRIQDGIQLMKTYYPHDPAWSAYKKVSEVTKRNKVTYAWDYEYEDYHPLDIFRKGSNTLNQMEQVKAFGSDIHLTLTADLNLTDEEITSVVQSLAKFGKVYLRLNHEANGYWFRYNLLHTRKEVNDFFVRFHKIMKSVSSNMYSVFNVSADVFMGARQCDEKLLFLAQNELAEALAIADYWSIDKYRSLHYAWPFEETFSETSTGYFNGSLEEWWRFIEETYLLMIHCNHGFSKPLFISEFNSDSNVNGYEEQAQAITEVYGRIAKGGYPWLAGIVLYQFRDYGGLGLEKGNLSSYETLPSLKAYYEAMKGFRAYDALATQAWNLDQFTFSWNDCSEQRGLEISDIPEESTFTNRLGVPLFVANSRSIPLQLLKPNEVYGIGESGSLQIWVPPRIQRGSMLSMFTVQALTDTFNGMVAP